jgi:hypothetical protein
MMAKHDELLGEGPRTAPEPETAEQRSPLRRRGALGGLAAGGAVAFKLGAFTKVVLWLAVWHGATSLLRYAGWPWLVAGIVAVSAVVAWVAWSRRRAEREAGSDLQGMSL